MASQFSIPTSFHASAPTSPSRINQNISNNNNNMFFYSVPPSPTRGMLDVTCDIGDGTTTTATATTTATTSPKAYEDANFTFDDFEFEISHIDDYDSETREKCDVVTEHEHEEEKKMCRKKRHESLPAIAFANELFCEGKVMPLNPPPCRQYSSFTDSNSISPSPPNATLFKIPYVRRNLWNDDFDPFMVALENVKEEKKRAFHRRAWSMLPLPACTQWQPDDLMGYEHKNRIHSNPHILCSNNQNGPDGPNFPSWVNHQQKIKDGLKSMTKLAEPKGVLFARRARVARMGYKGPKKPITEPMISEEDAGLSSSTENKWHKIMSFALRGGGSTMKKTSDEHKQKDGNVEFSRPKVLRKLSFRSKKLVEEECNEEKQVPQMTKMTVVRYRPKLLLCMGYKAKYAN